jgi:hypothetical protein
MPARKRAHEEMEAEAAVGEPSTLHKLRNMWQFANLAQYISLFGDAVKIDKDFDIEVRPACAKRHCGCAAQSIDERPLIRSQELESECLKPQASEKLAQIGLALLKHVSSHKGLTCVIAPLHPHTCAD